MIRDGGGVKQLMLRSNEAMMASKALMYSDLFIASSIFSQIALRVF